jgi:hypothetical protein
MNSVIWLLFTANAVNSSPIFVTLMMEEIHSPKYRFLQEPHFVTSQKMISFLVTSVKTSNLSFMIVI